MKLSESNIVKTLDNLVEVKQRAILLLQEMGYKIDSNVNNVQLFKDDSNLIIRNPLLGQEYKIPIGYLLDKEGKHENEYKDKKELREKINLERIKKTLK